MRRPACVLIALPLVGLSCNSLGGTNVQDDDSPAPDTGPHADTGTDTGSPTDTADTGDTGDDYVVTPWNWGEQNTTDDAGASFVGETAGGFIGSELLIPGDINGDGIDDLVASDYASSEMGLEAGEVYFIFGRESGWAIHESASELPSFVGPYAYQKLSELSDLGDVDGDGLADLALNGVEEGPYLVRGATDGWAPSMPVSEADASFVNISRLPGSTRWNSCDTPGDLDGDGLDDILLWAPVTNDGEVHATPGHDTEGTVPLPSHSSFWVYASEESDLASPESGDFTGDGLADLLVETEGSYHDIERLYLFAGSSDSLPYDKTALASATSILTHSQSDLDCSGDPAGDLDGDGDDEFLVHCVGEPTRIFLGRPSWPASLSPEDSDIAFDDLYATYGPMQDLDGDGIGEVVLLDDRRALIYFGRPEWPSELTADDADVTIEFDIEVDDLRAPQPHQQGDINGDGLGDLLLISPYMDWNDVHQVGYVALFNGREDWPSDLTTDDADAWFVGDVELQEMGGGLTVGDLNDDGYDDIVTRSDYHPAMTAEGEVFIFFGQAGP